MAIRHQIQLFQKITRNYQVYEITLNRIILQAEKLEVAILLEDRLVRKTKKQIQLDINSVDRLTGVHMVLHQVQKAQHQVRIDLGLQQLLIQDHPTKNLVVPADLSQAINQKVMYKGLLQVDQAVLRLAEVLINHPQVQEQVGEGQVQEETSFILSIRC